MAELKPCPFCGGEAMLDKVNGDHYCVRCRKCPTSLGRYWFFKRREAIEAWNRRAGDEP